jgi:hypothetical protein
MPNGCPIPFLVGTVLPNTTFYILLGLIWDEDDLKLGRRFLEEHSIVRDFRTFFIAF